MPYTRWSPNFTPLKTHQSEIDTHPDTPVCEVDVLPPQAAEFGDAQPMIEGEHEHGGIAPSITRMWGPLKQQGKFLFAEIVPRALMGIHGRHLRRTFDLTPHGRDSSPMPHPV